MRVSRQRRPCVIACSREIEYDAREINHRNGIEMTDVLWQRELNWYCNEPTNTTNNLKIQFKNASNNKFFNFQFVFLSCAIKVHWGFLLNFPAIGQYSILYNILYTLIDYILRIINIGLVQNIIYRGYLRYEIFHINLIND